MTQSKQSLYEKARERFRAIVFVGDCIMIVVSMLLGHLVRFNYFTDIGPGGELPSLLDYWNHYCIGLLLYVLLAHNQSLFRWTVMLSRARTLMVIIKVALLWGFAVLGLVLMIDFMPEISRFFMLFVTAFMVVGLTLWRYVMHAVLHKTGVFENAYRHMVVVGTGVEAEKLAQRVQEGRCELHRFCGFVSTHNHRSEDDYVLASREFGHIDNLEELMKEGRFDSLAVVDLELSRAELIRIAKLCERYFIDFKAMPNSFEVFTSCLEIMTVGGLPMMSLSELPQNRTLNRAMKRAVDIAGAVVGLCLSLPIYLVLVPLIKRESPGPILYKQIRTGQGGKEFLIYKLRSMRVNAEAGGTPGWSTKEDPRRTRIGTFMRKWNLDEIPQFWNVLRGDMSLVGPRPERPELINDFVKEIPYYQSRHSVKPGMTGWAQVNGLRGDTSIEERIRYDLQYIERWNMWMDLTIQFKTFFNYKGAY